MVHTSDGFDLDTYNKLMEGSGYDFSKPPSIGHVIDTKLYGPKDMKEII